MPATVISHETGTLIHVTSRRKEIDYRRRVEERVSLTTQGPADKLMFQVFLAYINILPVNEMKVWS